MRERIGQAWYRRVLIVMVLAFVLASGAAPLRGLAQTKDRADRPERGIAAYTEYAQLTVPAGESVRMDLTVENKGRRDEVVTIKLTTVPPGWKAFLKGGQFAVSGIPVASEKSRVLTLVAEPEKGLRPGTYNFQIEAASADQTLTVSQAIIVTTEERKGPAAGDLQISTSYPVLRGPTDSSFEFSLEVNNKSDGDRTVNLAAETPKGWDVNIKPAYEPKQITSLRIRSGSSQTVALEVKPPRDTEAGEYPLLFRAFTEKSQGEARLRVILTGIYKLDATTPTGRLSLDAVAGRPSTTTLLVRNAGSALNRNIKLSAFAPESWKVEFAPETVGALGPGALQQVEARITPAAQALVGDYSVAISADGEKSGKTLEMRVTVRAASMWGWLGVGIIAVVIGGLGGLFTWLGRR